MSDKKSNNQTGFKKTMANRNFLKLFIANVISRFGDSVDAIAYGYMVFEMTGSAALLATLFAVNGIPTLVVNMFSGVLVTYMPKKKVAWVCDLGRGLAVTITGILYFMGTLQVWHLFAFTLLNSTLEAFRTPASMSFFTLIVKEEDYEHATSLNSSGSTFAELIGYAFAGVLIGLVGASGAIIVDGLTFIISGLMIMIIKSDKEVLSKEKLSFAGYKRDMNEGIAYVLKTPLIRFLCLFAGGLGFFFIPFNTLQTAYILEDLGLSEYALSIMGVGFMSAMIIGSLLVPKFIGKVSGRVMFAVSGMIMGLGYFAFGLIAMFKGQTIAYLLIFLVTFVMGMSLAFINVPIQVALMKKVDREMLPRVGSFVSMLNMSSVPIGGALIGALVTFMEIKTLFFIFSICVCLIFFLQIFNKSLDDGSGVQDVSGEQVA